MAIKRKNLPYNEEIEKTIIGSLICSKEALYKILSMINIDDFYFEKHQTIYKAILSLQSKRLAIDTLTITEELLVTDELDSVGGVDYLRDCVDSFVSIASLNSYIDILKDNSDLRKLLTTIRNIDKDYKEGGLDTIESFIKDSMNKIRSCVMDTRTSSFKSLKTYANEALIKAETQRASGDGQTTGITCGYENINQFTRGFQRGEVTVIGARSGVGKTTLALNMAYRAALKTNIPIAIFELEMTGVSLANRLISVSSGVEASKIESGVLDMNEKLKIQTAVNELSQLPIFIDEGTQNTLLDIETKTRQLLDKYPNLGLVVVDHLSIVSTSGGKKSDTRVDEMRKISRGLHSIAKELNVAVLAVAQLNRDSVKGEIRRPRMCDIKESGAIEQDADVIILLYDSMYENSKINQNKKLDDIRHVEAIIAKQRHGRSGIANLIFLKNYSRFDAPAKEWEEELLKINSGLNRYV